MDWKWAGGDFSAYIPQRTSKFSIHKCIRILNNADILHLAKVLILAFLGQYWAGADFSAYLPHRTSNDQYLPYQCPYIEIFM